MSPRKSPSSGRSARALPGLHSLLVHVQATHDAPLRVAADLARRCDATLIGVGAETLSGLGLGDPFADGDWIADLRALVHENLGQAEAAFRAQTTGLRTQWLSLQMSPATAVAAAARGADLIVAGEGASGGSASALDLGALIIRAGRPVLVAPRRRDQLRGGPALVAWKDTREARRAVVDSLPLLKGAAGVTVMEVCAVDAYAEAELHTFEIVQYLARHGIAARARAVIAPPESVGLELSTAADALDAELIVAGAYGRTRLGEWVFGGTTRDLLQDPRRFLLLSH